MVIHKVTLKEFEEIFSNAFRIVQQRDGTYLVDCIMGSAYLADKYPDDELKHLRVFEVVDGDEKL